MNNRSVQTLFSRFRKILRIIVVALAIALIFSIALTFVLEYIESTQIESFTPTTTITISNETRFAPPYQGFVKRGYFDSVAIVYVYLSSPYASDWKTFNVWVSLDNSSWTLVPFLGSTTNNRTQMANLGLIDLYNPKLTVFQKYYIPPQTVFTPPNVTRQDLEKYTANMEIVRQATPADTTQWISVFFAIFGVVFSVIGVILSLLFSGTQNAGGRRKKNIVHTCRKKVRLLGLLESILSFRFLDTWQIARLLH